MEALSQEEIYALADEYIDKKYNHPEGFNNKKLREVGNKEAMMRTLCFVGGFGLALEMSAKSLNEAFKKY
jgi:hypothetical protein